MPSGNLRSVPSVFLSWNHLHSIDITMPAYFPHKRSRYMEDSSEQSEAAYVHPPAVISPGILFRMDIVEGVIMHTLGKIDRIQYFHFISMPYQHLSALNDDRPFRVRDHITDVFSHLHQVGFYIKTCLS